jgi:hypothetical protein
LFKIDPGGIRSRLWKGCSQAITDPLGHARLRGPVTDPPAIGYDSVAPHVVVPPKIDRQAERAIRTRLAGEAARRGVGGVSARPRRHTRPRAPRNTSANAARLPAGNHSADLRGLGG